MLVQDTTAVLLTAIVGNFAGNRIRRIREIYGQTADSVDEMHTKRETGAAQKRQS